MFDFVTRYKNKLLQMRNDVDFTAKYFYSLALVRAYADMVELFASRIKGHPEVARVPELASIMMEHFQTYPSQHIDIYKDQIFNREFVGTISTLKDWQQAGYPLDRSPDNYSWRVTVFEAIWRQVPIRITVTAVSKRGKVYSFPVVFRPRNMKQFVIATYEDIIRSRNSNFGNVVRTIPMWLPFNYGTAGLEGDPGYPNVPGLHFVDIAEQLIVVRRQQTNALLKQYYSETFSDTDTYIDARDWARSHAPNLSSKYIDVFSLALRISLGE